MTTREMVTSLMIECLEDAMVARTERASFLTPEAGVLVAATLAAAMFKARWEQGSVRLLSAVRRHPEEVQR